MPSSSIDNCARVSAHRTHRWLAATRSVHAPGAWQTGTAHRRPTTALDQIAAPAAKDKHMPGERILLQRRLHQRAQPVETTPQISHAGRDPDLRLWPAARSSLQRLQHHTQQRSISAVFNSKMYLGKLDVDGACRGRGPQFRPTTLGHGLNHRGRWPTRSRSPAADARRRWASPPTGPRDKASASSAPCWR